MQIINEKSKRCSNIWILRWDILILLSKFRNFGVTGSQYASVMINVVGDCAIAVQWVNKWVLGVHCRTLQFYSQMATTETPHQRQEGEKVTTPSFKSQDLYLFYCFLIRRPAQCNGPEISYQCDKVQPMLGFFPVGGRKSDGRGFPQVHL